MNELARNNESSNIKPVLRLKLFNSESDTKKINGDEPKDINSNSEPDTKKINSDESKDTNSNSEPDTKEINSDKSKDTDSNSCDTDSVSSDELYDTNSENKSEIKKNFPLDTHVHGNEVLCRIMQVMSLSVDEDSIFTCLKIVMDENPEYNLNNHRGYWCAPLHYATIVRLEEVAIYFIEKGADVNKLDIYQNNPLNYAVGLYDYGTLCDTKRENKEMPKLVNKLIEKQVNVGNINGISKLYPVHEAIKNQYYNSHYLIRLRMYYVLNTDIPFIKETDEYKNLMKLKNEESTEPEIGIDKLISLIVKKDEKRAILYLEKDLTLAHGIDLHGQSMLHYAVHGNMRKLIKRLVELDINYNRKNVHNLTAFGICDMLEKDGKNGNSIKKFLTETIVNHKKSKENEKLTFPNSPMSHDELNFMLQEEEDKIKKEELKKTEANKKKKEKAKQKKLEIQKKKEESNIRKLKLIEEQKEKDRILREEKIERDRLENERIEKEKYENFLKEQEIKRNKKYDKIKKMKEKKYFKKQKELEKKLENDIKIIDWKKELHNYSPTDDEKELYERACNLIEIYEQNDGMDILPSGKRVPIVFL